MALMALKPLMEPLKVVKEQMWSGMKMPLHIGKPCFVLYKGCIFPHKELILQRLIQDELRYQCYD